MNKARLNIVVSKLVGNSGQLDWLPRNPRQWTQGDIDKTVRSIQRDPDFLEDRPLLAVPAESGKGERYVVFAGNLRLKACKETNVKTAPVVVYFPESDEDRETVKRRAMLDNGSFGSWDFDELANKWDDLPLVDLGIPAWDTSAASDLGLSTAGREGEEGYDEFVDKFKQKLTTDDCYTPPAVYDVVRDFVDAEVAPLKGRTVVRPFVPGGDYENYNYPENCAVIDNPPFSILSKILRFYCEKKIDFFLFGPHLTLFSAPDIREITYLPLAAPVTYENGAVVSTGFITNMRPGMKIWIPSGLRHRIVEVQRDMTPQDEYHIPPVVVTSSRLGAIAGCLGGALEIKDDECVYIRNLDAMQEQGKGLYGGGTL